MLVRTAQCLGFLDKRRLLVPKVLVKLLLLIPFPVLSVRKTKLVYTVWQQPHTQQEQQTTEVVGDPRGTEGISDLPRVT